ncbi:MAG: uracil-DNA glycosylase [Spirochaetales bacterium]|jgi:DNA polymerase|nr:uracil-DNA glycosylase [Spirochaetales bacterium]
MDSFMDVLKQDFGPKQREKHDFSDVSAKIIPEEKQPETEPAASMLPETPEAPARTEDDRIRMSYASLLADSATCTRCGLCSTRHSVVFGTGCKDRPVVMVIGEGPGENEDLQGLPFVGKAGVYLDKWLAAISLSRDTNVYITNTVKCRPPQNRDPYPDEKSACNAYLKRQIQLVNPQAILCLGKPASTLMTGQPDATMGALRGRFFFYDGIPMMCTYHPAAVLRDLSLKRAVWEDLKKLARYLGLPAGGSN